MARQWPNQSPVKMVDRGAFAERVLEVMEGHGDMASEACWQELSRVVAQFWLVFQADQSPLSTWNMLARCTETILRIRVMSKGMRGESGADALEEFRAF